MNFKFLNNKSQSGFTLIEVLIAMSILAMISYGIYQATTESFRLREVLSSEGNFYNGIRISMTILQRDLSLVYSPTITLPPKPVDPNNPGTQQQPPPTDPALMADDLVQTSTFWSPAVAVSGLRPSRFIGSDTKISFISVSHLRIYKDAHESDFAKVTYELRKEEKNREFQGTSVLVKTEDSNAFWREERRDSKTQRSYELLHGVKSINFTYLQREGETWKRLKSWDSDHQDTKNIIPDLIELKIVVQSPKETFDGIFKFRSEIPINGFKPQF